MTRNPRQRSLKDSRYARTQTILFVFDISLRLYQLFFIVLHITKVLYFVTLSTLESTGDHGT